MKYLVIIAFCLIVTSANSRADDYPMDLQGAWGSNDLYGRTGIDVARANCRAYEADHQNRMVSLGKKHGGADLVIFENNAAHNFNEFTKEVDINSTIQRLGEHRWKVVDKHYGFDERGDRKSWHDVTYEIALDFGASGTLMTIARRQTVDNKTGSFTYEYLKCVPPASELGQLVQRWTDTEVQIAIRNYTSADAGCRGGSGDANDTWQVCGRRDVWSSLLQAAGWCYGIKDQPSANFHWHKCNSMSIKEKHHPKNSITRGLGAAACYDYRRGGSAPLPAGRPSVRAALYMAVMVSIRRKLPSQTPIFVSAPLANRPKSPSSLPCVSFSSSSTQCCGTKSMARRRLKSSSRSLTAKTVARNDAIANHYGFNTSAIQSHM